MAISFMIAIFIYLNMRVINFTLFLVVLLAGCKSETNKNSYLKVFVSSCTNKKIYLERIGILGNKNTVIDSGVITSKSVPLFFKLPSKEECLYRVKDSTFRLNILFINDADSAEIHADYALPEKYSFINSKASNSLQEFQSKQSKIALKGSQIYKEWQDLKNSESEKEKLSEIEKAILVNSILLNENNFNFADTTKSIGAFFAVYNNIEFNKDFKKQKAFLNRALQRFSNNQYIQLLKQRTVDYIKIFEEELNVGDTLPFISLPDKSLNIYSTANLKNKYYLIDFWSTWCNRCGLHSKFGNKILEQINRMNVTTVSVAIDAEKYSWQQSTPFISNGHIDLIDTLMWEGETVKKLKFDSIPFNFFVSPKGKILAKAIKPDSLISVIKKHVEPATKF